MQKTETPILEQVQHLSDSGYVRLKSGGVHAYLDVGRVGPDYLMGHAHADTLTFELSYNEHRLIVNSGTSCYGKSKQRLWQRSTAAHNTVVDETNSSEIWDSFRVAKRAYPGKVVIQKDFNEDIISVSSSHNGYVRFFPNLIHKRSWVISNKSFSILDKIENNTLSAYASFYFHPDVFVDLDYSGYKGILKLKDKIFATFVIHQGKPSVKETNWYPKFGVSVPNQCLCLS